MLWKNLRVLKVKGEFGGEGGQFNIGNIYIV